jgi:hypothetical protein
VILNDNLNWRSHLPCGSPTWVTWLQLPYITGQVSISVSPACCCYKRLDRQHKSSSILGVTWRHTALIMATYHEIICKNTGTSTAPTARNTLIYTHTTLRTLPTWDTNLGSQTVATPEARDFVESIEPTCKHSLPAQCYIPAFSQTFRSCTVKLSELLHALWPSDFYIPHGRVCIDFWPLVYYP